MVDSTSLEWLRVVLDEVDMSHQSNKNWKAAMDSKFEEKGGQDWPPYPREAQPPRSPASGRDRPDLP